MKEGEEIRNYHNIACKSRRYRTGSTRRDPWSQVVWSSSCGAIELLWVRLKKRETLPLQGSGEELDRQYRLSLSPSLSLSLSLCGFLDVSDSAIIRKTLREIFGHIWSFQNFCFFHFLLKCKIYVIYFISLILLSNFISS